jgi:hypothetical protein
MPAMRPRATGSRTVAVFVLAIAAAQMRGDVPIGAEFDPVHVLVAELTLDRYKATLKSLTAFGDRRQGTARNRAANDWIEAQLRAYRCANVDRLHYVYEGPPEPPPGRVDTPNPVIASGEVRLGRGGSRMRGVAYPSGINYDPMAQPDVQLRQLNSQPSTSGARDQVYCTKVGTSRPDEMYIVGAHMDGLGWGEGADDNASGTALVLELARIFSDPDVHTERSIRFVLWNNEETDLAGSRAYVNQRASLQGREDPPGSGQYPEPKWLGVIQHDMVLFDHGMRRPDGSVNPEQRPEADLNIEFQSGATFGDEAMKLALVVQAANEKYASDYPAVVGPHMSNTDSVSFMNLVPAISVRENERGAQIGAGWSPHRHQATDMFAAYSDKDFQLGLNAAQTTLAAIARLAGARVTR